MARPPRTPLHVSARVLPFVPPGRSLSILVSAKGMPVATWTFGAADWTEAKATIPPEAVGPDGRLDLTFTADGVVSPAAAGLGPDTRDLKLMLQRMDLSE